jgi:hypothetical protein
MVPFHARGKVRVTPSGRDQVPPAQVTPGRYTRYQPVRGITKATNLLNSTMEMEWNDHTSIIVTLRARFGLGALERRDGAAPDVGSVLTCKLPGPTIFSWATATR